MSAQQVNTPGSVPNCSYYNCFSETIDTLSSITQKVKDYVVSFFCSLADLFKEAWSYSFGKKETGDPQETQKENDATHKRTITETDKDLTTKATEDISSSDGSDSDHSNDFERIRLPKTKSESSLDKASPGMRQRIYETFSNFHSIMSRIPSKTGNGAEKS